MGKLETDRNFSKTNYGGTFENRKFRKRKYECRIFENRNGEYRNCENKEHNYVRQTKYFKMTSLSRSILLSLIGKHI